MSDYSTAVLADSPLLYWRLGESSGTNANDETANNRDGTYTGGFTLGVAGPLAGDADTAIDLDGTNGCVRSAYDTYVAGSQRTFECWFNRDTQGTTDTIFGEDFAAAPALRANSASRTLHWVAPGNPTWTNVLPVAPTGWLHIVFTWDDATFIGEVFLNGVSQGTQAGSAAMDAGGRNFSIGIRGASSDPFDGKLDEAAVYSGILSAARIAVHYSTGVPFIAARNKTLLGAG